MKIDYKFTDSISIVDIAKALNLKKMGTNWKCPNTAGHNKGDKNPSMNIDESKGVFNCFACGAKGQRLDLIQLTQGGDRESAYKWLSENFGGRCAKSTPEKLQMRFISADGGRRFTYQVPNGLRQPEQHDIDNIAETLHKRFTLDGLRLAGAQINTFPYALTMPKLNFFSYINNESDKAIVLEGMTDFISALSLGLGATHNIISRKAVRQGVDIPEHVNDILYIVDPENIDENGDLQDLLQYIHGRRPGITEKYLCFTFAELKSFEAKDLSDFVYEYNKDTLFNIINNNSRGMDSEVAPRAALYILGRIAKNRWLRFIRDIGKQGLRSLQREEYTGLAYCTFTK